MEATYWAQREEASRPLARAAPFTFASISLRKSCDCNLIDGCGVKAGGR